MQAIDLIAETQRSFADALPVLVMMSDAAGVVNFFNRAWFDYTGQPRFDRDVTETWQQYIHPDDLGTVAASWYAAMESGKDVVIEYRIRSGASGEWRWFSAHAHALRDASGRIVQWIGTAMDIHDARETKDTIERLYTQQRFVAESFQRAALPHELPKLNGIRFDALYEPSASDLLVGGDWYDAFPLPNGMIAVSVGDVHGHGLDAAVLMSKLRQLFRAVALRAADFQNRDPASIVSSVEKIMSMENDGALASAFFGIIDLSERTIQYSNAGHPPPLLHRANGTMEELLNGNMLLGIERAPRTSAVASLSDVASLVCYTDGLVEFSRDLFEGESRLRAAVQTLSKQNPEKPAQFLLEEIHPTSMAFDDLAVLVMTFETH